MALQTYGAVGTGIQTPAAQLSATMNAITQKYVIPTLGDAVLKPSPGFWAMTRRGVRCEGGELVYPILAQEELTGGAYYGDQLLNTTVVDSIIPATQVWKSYYQSVAIPILDAVLNRGQSGVLPLMKTKFQVACGSLLQKLSRALWHASPQNTTLDIDDIDSWITNQVNTIAGIDRTQGAYAFWLPGPTLAVGGPLTATKAEQIYQSVVFGYDEPDLCLIDGTGTKFTNFKQNFTTENRYTDMVPDDDAIQAGFRYHFMFNNAIVLPDRFATSGEVVFINTKYMHPVFHEADYFHVDPFVKPSNQRVVVSQIYLTWNLINMSPRMGATGTGLT